MVYCIQLSFCQNDPPMHSFSANTLQKLLVTFFQILDIWWSSLDIVDDFKFISRTAFFHFGEIKENHDFEFCQKTFFLIFFSSLLHFEL